MAETARRGKASEHIDDVRDRRLAAVDEARGLVILIVVFDHSATKKTVHVKGIGELEVAAYHQEPNSVLIAELFKVRSGGIAHIEAILEFAPYSTRTGWEAAQLEQTASLVLSFLAADGSG